MWGTEGGPKGQLHASWAKRRYHIRDGYLRPIPGTALTRYNPFDGYYGTDHCSQGERSLYLQMVELDLNSRGAVEEFTERWGLLGMFQHRLIEVRHLPPKREDRRLAHAGVVEAPDTDLSSYARPFDPRLKRLHQDPDPHLSWFVSLLPTQLIAGLIEEGHLAVSPTGEPIFPQDPEVLLELARLTAVMMRNEYEAALDSFPSGTVLVQSERGLLQQLPREPYYRHYLPDWQPLPPTPEERERGAVALETVYGYPRLHSDLLWEHLCEPLAEFKAAILELRQLYALCARLSSPADADSASRQGRLADVQALTLSFQRHLRRIHPSPRYSAETDAWTWSWSFPSLLSAAYAMLFLDFMVEGRKLRFCANQTCGKSFVTERVDRRYCCPNCQNTQKIRDYRAQKRGQQRSPKAGNANSLE